MYMEKVYLVVYHGGRSVALPAGSRVLSVCRCPWADGAACESGDTTRANRGGRGSRWSRKAQDDSTTKAVFKWLCIAVELCRYPLCMGAIDLDSTIIFAALPRQVPNEHGNRSTPPGPWSKHRPLRLWTCFCPPHPPVSLKRWYSGSRGK